MFRDSVKWLCGIFLTLTIIQQCASVNSYLKHKRNNWPEHILQIRSFYTTEIWETMTVIKFLILKESHYVQPNHYTIHWLLLYSTVHFLKPLLIIFKHILILLKSNELKSPVIISHLYYSVKTTTELSWQNSTAVKQMLGLPWWLHSCFLCNFANWAAEV